MQTCQHAKSQPRVHCSAPANRAPYPVGNFFRHCNGYSWFRVFIGHAALQQLSYFLGSRPAFAARNRASLHTRPTQANYHPGRCKPPCRCFVGDGGRAAMHIAGRGHRRALGESQGVGFHRNQTTGVASGALWSALLADPARGLARSQRGAQSLADVGVAVPAKSGRPKSARRSALAGRAVPVAPRAARHLDCDP